jgi:TRAP transporter TAXI family solute receptor
VKEKAWIKASIIIGMTLLINALLLPRNSSAKDTVQLEVYSAGPAGTGAYVASLAISQVISELHPWLRATNLESLGTADAVTTTDALEPGRRKHSFIMSMPNVEFTKARLGEKPYKRKYNDLKFIATISIANFGFCTYNPDIKSPRDLIGKTIAVFMKGSAPTTLSDAILRDGWGIYDKIRLSYHSPMAFGDILTTRVADAAFGVLVVPLKGGKFGSNPYFDTIRMSRTTYWLGVSEEDIERINERNPWKASREMIPKDALGAGQPAKDTGLISVPTIMAGWDMGNEEVVYELTKFLAENADTLSSRLQGRPFGLKFMTQYPGLTEDMVHPGALRYYREKGVIIGR